MFRLVEPRPTLLLSHPIPGVEPMAIGFLYTCTCGRRFKAYVPKQKLFHTVTGNSVDWERIDRREEDDGCVEDVERQANVTQCSFVDVRGGERFEVSLVQSRGESDDTLPSGHDEPVAPTGSLTIYWPASRSGIWRCRILPSSKACDSDSSCCRSAPSQRKSSSDSGKGASSRLMPWSR